MLMYEGNIIMFIKNYFVFTFCLLLCSYIFFLGLLKGSKEEISAPKAERPKSLRKLRSVYEHGSSQQEQAPTKLLSPFDEQEEWAKISEIMASFGTGLVRESVFVSELEKEFQARLGNEAFPKCVILNVYFLPFYSNIR